MEDSFPEANILVWKRSVFLSKAIEVFARPSNATKWKELQETSALKLMNDYVQNNAGKSNAVGDVIQGALAAANPVISGRSCLWAEMQTDIIRWSVSGALVGFGFETPRHVTSKPLVLPTEVWKGRIDWGNSSLTYQGLSFEQVKLLTKRVAIELKAKSPESEPNSTQRGPGRPTVEAELIECFNALVASGSMNANDSLASHFPSIREWLSKNYPNLKPSPSRLSEKTTQRHL